MNPIALVGLARLRNAPKSSVDKDVLVSQRIAEKREDVSDGRRKVKKEESEKVFPLFLYVGPGS